MTLFTHYLLALAFTFIADLFLAVFVVCQKINKKIKWTFFFYSLCISIWALGQGYALYENNKIISLLSVRFCHAGVVFIPTLFVHFIMILMNISEKKKNILQILYSISIFFFIINLGPFIVQGVDQYPPIFDYVYVPGFAHPIMLVFWVFTVFYGIVLVFNGYIHSIGPKHNQLKYFFWATLFAYIGGVPNFLLGYRIQIPILMPFGTYILPIYVGILAYAILAHRLMDIEVIIKKTLVFAGLFVAAYAVLASFAYLGSAIFENVFRNRWMAIVPSVFIIVIMLRPLENFLRNITDKYLFQKEYDYKELLKTFTDEVLTVLDLKKLVYTTVNKLADIIKLENAAILLYSEDNKEYKMAASLDNKDEKYSLSDDEKIVHFMKYSGEYILLGDLGQKRLIDVTSDIKERMHDLGASLIIPLIHYKDMIGMLILGKKKSDEEFAQDDIDILLPLARALTIAINNAQLFEKLSEAQAQAAQREKMAVIGTLSAGINHEICNPLSIIRGQCEMFLLNFREGLYRGKSNEELLEKAQNIMKKVVKETDRATIITRKLSSFSKPANRKFEENVKIEHELNEVLTLVEHDLKLSNIDIIKNMEDGLPCVVADSKQLQEIFFNIIRNAAQSIESKGKITINAKSMDGKVQIDIEDTGSGISKENLKQVFNPFFTTKAPGRGTGLGLFIVKQIVEKNGGEILVDSELGKGTVVSLRFNTTAKGGGVVKGEKTEDFINR